MSTEKQVAIEAKVQKLFEAGFIREEKYPTWLANVVLVRKANGKWRMQVDYTDLMKDPKNLAAIKKERKK